MAYKHILGAGLSGMVAALNLAREGYEVRILEGAKKIGGMDKIHPSIHGTPIDTDAVSRYIGFDISPHFTPARYLLNGVEDHLYRVDGNVIRLVERGGRETAFDQGLYRECLRLGVKFEFGQFINNLNELPPGSIIATGFNRSMFDALDVPYMTHYGYSTYFEQDRKKAKKTMYSFFDHYTEDYYYAGELNGLYYGLLFSRTQLPEKALEALQQQLKDRTGLQISDWACHSSAVPVKSYRNPRLFVGDKILAGTLAGMIEPFALFGIHGATISGKIAALAVTNRNRATTEFKRCNRYFPFCLTMRRIFHALPGRLKLMRYFNEYPQAMLPMISLLDRGLPGYTGHYMGPMLNRMEKVSLENFRQSVGYFK